MHHSRRRNGEISDGHKAAVRLFQYGEPDSKGPEEVGPRVGLSKAL